MPLVELFHFCVELLYLFLDAPQALDKLAELWGVKGEKNPEQAAARFEALFDELGLEHIHCHDPATLEMLAASVNPQRLGNTPVTMGYEDLLEMYKRILA